MQRGSGEQSIFRDADDYAIFLRWLRDGARQFKVAVHAYVLLPNQVQLLVTPADAQGLGRMMQWMGRYYVPYFNRKYARNGTLWQGRFKAAVIEPEKYFLTCSRYIELGPLRAGMITHPAEYRWSSYAHHAGIKPDPLITDHPLYWALGNTPFDREAVYKALAEQPLSVEQAGMVNEATLAGRALGSEKFLIALEKKAACRILPAKKGRPLKLREISAPSES